MSATSAGSSRGRLPGTERKTQIVQATLRLVAEHGLVGASMSRIADAVGISNAALYRHFASREDILIAAHDALIERVFAWLNSSRAPNVIDRLREMGESHARIFSKDIEGFNAPMFQFISWIPRDRVRDHVVRRRVEMLHWYADLVEEGKAQGNIRADIETDLIVSELFAWIWWEDLSYLEGLDTETTLRGSANMFARLLARISPEPPRQERRTAQPRALKHGGTKMPKSLVAIAKGDDPEKMVAEVFSLLGGVENLVKPHSTVVLKPNAGHPAAAETSVNTSPELVAAVVKEVKKGNPKDIIVAEAAAIGCDSLHVLDVSGIGAAAEAAGARLIDIKREKDLINIPIRDARSDVKKVKLPRFLLEAEHIFNLPIFKSHASMVFTCALKNMKGVVQDITHQQMHMTDLAAAMMDVWSVIRADLTIADLIHPAEGFGPHTTIPVDFGCVVASKDPVALDATACRMVGLAIEKVAYFAPAAERNLGFFKEEDIEVVGRTIEEVRKDLWFPYLEGFDTWPEYTFYTSNACSSCESLVAFTMEKLKALGEYDKNAGCHVMVGSKRDDEMPQGADPNDVILIGDCVKRFRGKAGHWSAGCPPLEPHPLWVFIDREDHFEMEPYFRQRMAQDEKPWVEHIAKMREKRQKTDR